MVAWPPVRYPDWESLEIVPGLGSLGTGGSDLGGSSGLGLRRHDLRTTADAAFGRVAQECRTGREPRWLTDPLLAALTALHAAGWAHSISSRRKARLLIRDTARRRL